MKKLSYFIYGFIIAALSVFTGEMVTFIMLGLILITLENIHRTLKEILEEKRKVNEAKVSD